MGALFDELAMGTLRAENRLVRAATYEALATDDGHLTPELRGIYEELAAGGVGTIITSYAYSTADEQPNPRMLGIYDDSFIPEYRSLVDAVHERGVSIVLQMVYGGSSTKLNPPSKRILGPSAVPHPRTGIVPLEATEDDISMLVDAFAAAAQRAQRAGFDGVELHAAHGYLLSQFLSPVFNHRKDRYGGSIKNRTRMLVECIRAIRARTDEGFPVLVKLNSSDGIEGGLTEDDSIAAAKLLVEAGAAGIEVSGAWRACRIRDYAGEPFFAAYAQRLAREIDASVILTGGNRSAVVLERLVAESGIAAFGLCRPLICEPDLPNRWKADPSRPAACISCNGCDSSPGHRCILP